MQIINGKAIAAELLEKLKALPVPKKFFAGIVIGDDPASESFQKLKQKTAARLGVDYRIYHLAPELGNDGLRKKIGRIGAQSTCGAVIVQFPLPAPLNKHYIANAIPHEKDPDVLSERSLGAFYANRNPALHPAAATVEEILLRTNFNPGEKKVAVVGPGFLIGKPVATWLTGRARDLYILDRGADFSILKTCDLVISGAGKIGLLTADMLREGAGVIDFSYSKNEEGNLVGDFDPSSPETEKLSFYTPTPRGTGPILVAKLFENFYKLNSKS